MPQIHLRMLLGQAGVDAPDIDGLALQLTGALEGPREHHRPKFAIATPSFTESFPLFGYDLADYDVLFEEKIELFARLLEEKPVTWVGVGTRRPQQPMRRRAASGHHV